MPDLKYRAILALINKIHPLQNEGRLAIKVEKLCSKIDSSILQKHHILNV